MTHGGHPPEGQPYPAPRIRVVKNKKGKRIPLYVFPRQILTVRTKGDLVHALKHYSHPMPMVEGSVHLKTQEALRHMVEWVFPALRWYCRVFGVDIPTWLHGNGWANHLNDEEHKKFLGEKPLDVHEFREKKAHAGTRA